LRHPVYEFDSDKKQPSTFFSVLHLILPSLSFAMFMFLAVFEVTFKNMPNMKLQFSDHGHRKGEKISQFLQAFIVHNRICSCCRTREIWMESIHQIKRRMFSKL